MAAMEYYQAAPGQSFASDPPTLVGKPDQPAAPSQVQPSAPNKPPSKANAEDYFSPHAPNSAFVPAYVVNAQPVDDDVLHVPPPRINNLGNITSPPALQDPTSPVTDESDGSVVHIHHIHQAPRHDSATPNSKPSPPPSHQSGTLSLTHSNLQHHDGFDSSDRSPSHGRGPASKKRLRPRELSTHSKDTLIQLLIRQEYQVDDCKKALKNALEKLERYKSDLADANSHCRRVEKLYQRLADERMMMQTQVSDAVGKAQQQSYTAQQELSIFKLKLEHAENALASAKTDLREVKLQRDKARSDADRSRDELHHIREERNVREAREQGRKQGYDEGVKQGHVLGITQTVPPATTSAGEPSTSHAPAPSNPNTSVTSSHSRTRTATSQSDKRSSPSRASKSDIEDLAQKIRRETEERYQRQFDQQLEQERQRLQILKLEQDQERDRELVEEREKFRHSVEAREQQRSAELEAEIETLRQLERQRSEEVKNEQQKASVLRVERDKEKELKEKEQRERQRERQEREQERAEEARRLEQEQQNVSRQRQLERTEAMQRDRDRDRAVTEATAQAARATAQANAAAAAASASRPKSRASASSSGSEQGRSYLQGTPRNQPYFPMPRPPMGMPVPDVAQSRVVQPLMSMPEPNVNPLGRSSRSPQAPVTIPAAVSMPQPNVNPGGYSRSPQPPVTMPAGVSMPEPSVNYSSRSPQPPVTVPASMSMPEPIGRSSRSPRAPVTMPEPSINIGSHYSRSPQPPVTIPAAVSIPEPNVNPVDYSRPSSRSAGQPNLPSTVPGRHRSRRSSMESQSSVSTVAGGLDKLVSFPVPATGVPGRTPSNNSGGPAFIPPLPEPSSRNNNRQSSHSRNSSYTRPNVTGGGGGRDPLSDIPEDASFRLSPGVSSRFGGQGPVIPSLGMPEPDSSSRPVVPNIRVEGDDHYLDAPGRRQLHRSDSGPSICGITVEPPSGPSTPLEGGPAPLHHQHHHHSADPNLLSPNHIPTPALPQVPSQQPVLPRRADSPVLPVRVNVTGGGGRGGGGGGEERVIPTQPNTPVIPDAQYLPPNFIPQSFTPHTNATPTLPDVVMNPPPGFIPQSVTDARTGLTTPLTSMNPLPGDDIGGGGGGGGEGSRRQSIFGNSGTSPYMGSPLNLTEGPPVIPTFGDMDNGGSSRGTPRSGMYTPGGSTRGLPGSSVYQNPAEGDEDEDNDDLVARNTRINATAPPITVKQKKKKRR